IPSGSARWRAVRTTNGLPQRLGAVFWRAREGRMAPVGAHALRPAPAHCSHRGHGPGFRGRVPGPRQAGDDRLVGTGEEGMLSQSAGLTATALLALVIVPALAGPVQAHRLDAQARVLADRSVQVDAWFDLTGAP